MCCQPHLKLGEAAAAAALVPGLLSACDEPQRMEARPVPEPGVGSAGVSSIPQERDWESVRSELDESLTPYADVTGYNNFYEFGTGKEDPARYAHTLVTRPWTVEVDGEVARPAVYDLDDLLAPHTAEDRIYRLRCVEAWSMVIPWTGIPLADVIRRLEPTSKARFVEFITLKDPEQMPGQRRRVLDFRMQLQPLGGLRHRRLNRCRPPPAGSGRMPFRATLAPGDSPLSIPNPTDDRRCEENQVVADRRQYRQLDGPVASHKH